MIPELALFDDILISGEVGRIKPDPELFRVACQRIGVTPGETFVVDDRPGNVEGARQFGFTAIQFAGADALRTELECLSVLSNARKEQIT